jgi:hypothetical protein
MKIYHLVVVAGCLLNSPAFGKQPLKIKGFYLGQSKEEVQKLKPEGVWVEQEGSELVFSRNEKFGVASFSFRNGVLTAFTLPIWFFNAENFVGDRFIKSVLDSYPIKNVQCETGQLHTGHTVNICRGFGPNEEWVRVHEREVIVQTPPNPGAKPSFN